MKIWKKKLTVLGILLLIATQSYAYEVDANSIFGNRGVGLRPYSRYTLTCPSIINNINTGDRSNLRFFFQDNEPFEYKKRAANVLVLKTFNTSSSYFEVFTEDGNSASINYNIKNENKKLGAIVGNCRIEP